MLFDVKRLNMIRMRKVTKVHSKSITSQVKRLESDSVGFSAFREIPMIGARSGPNVGIRCGPDPSDDFRRPETIDSGDRILATSDHRILTEPIEFDRIYIGIYTYWKHAG